MTPQNLAVFKYRHSDPVIPWWAAIGMLVAAVAIIVALFQVFEGLALFAGVAMVMVLLARWPKRQLVMAPRYFLCGRTIVYYANVRQLVLRPGESLSVAWGDNHHFKLELDRFPTGARKSHKIAANKLKKFNKVSGKIIDRVRLFSPKVQLSTGKAARGKGGR